MARGVPLVRRLVLDEAGRFLLTIAGVAMAVVLLCGVLALDSGVRREANSWVAERPISAWVAQGRTTNFIKASSFLPATTLDRVRAVPGVAEATPLLRLITELTHDDHRVTAIIIGLDHASTAGRPAVTAGTGDPGRDGIVLDRALAHRLRARVGDTIRLEDHPLRVTGLARGTNAVLTQYAFIDLAQAEHLLPFPGIISYLLVRGDPALRPDTLASRLRAAAPELSVLTQQDFAAYNVEELRGGIVPILVAVAILGSVVAAMVLALLLYGAVLERREDYALLKALGAPTQALVRVVVGQALAAVGGGLLSGFVLFRALEALAARVAPAVPLHLPMPLGGVVVLGALVVGLAASLIPLARVARIHPAEVFRA